MHRRVITFLYMAKSVKLSTAAHADCPIFLTEESPAYGLGETEEPNVLLGHHCAAFTSHTGQPLHWAAYRSTTDRVGDVGSELLHPVLQEWRQRAKGENREDSNLCLYWQKHPKYVLSSLHACWHASWLYPFLPLSHAFVCVCAFMYVRNPPTLSGGGEDNDLGTAEFCTWYLSAVCAWVDT